MTVVNRGPVEPDVRQSVKADCEKGNGRDGVALVYPGPTRVMSNGLVTHPPITTDSAVTVPPATMNHYIHCGRLFESVDPAGDLTLCAPRVINNGHHQRQSTTPSTYGIEQTVFAGT